MERRAAHDELRRRRAELRAAPGELASVDQHQADDASEMYDREVLVGTIADLEEHLRALDRAERRIADGTYGRSVLSGEPIDDERLASLPTAELTAQEAEAHAEAAVVAAGADASDETPLDRPEGPPGDLADIPMGNGSPEVDPQEASDRVDLPIGGGAYEGESGAPRVGRADPDDPALRRDYRPER